MSEQVEKYLEWKSTHTRRAYLVYKPWLMKLTALVNNKPVTEVTLEDVIHYKKMLDAKHQPASIQLAMVTVHNFFKWCSTMRYNTLSHGLIRVPKMVYRARPVVFPEDYQKMLAFYKGKIDFLSIRNNLIIHLLWDTGMRVSELCDLNAQDMDMNKREATVRTRKSFKMRQVYWSFTTNAILREYTQRHKALTTSPSLFVGVSPTGISPRLSSRSVQRVITDLASEVGLDKRLTPHSFRHGKAHRILALGGNPKHIQSILGHSETNPMASFVYMQWNDKESRLASSQFIEEEVYSLNNTSGKANVAKSE